MTASTPGSSLRVSTAVKIDRRACGHRKHRHCAGHAQWVCPFSSCFTARPAGVCHLRFCHLEVQSSCPFLAVAGMIKLALPAGKANPAPPVGPALGAKVGLVKCVTPATHRGHPLAGRQIYIAQPAALEQRSVAPPLRRHDLHHMCLCCPVQGVNIMAFCKEYNARTQDKIGTIIPVEITVFDVSPGSSDCPVLGPHVCS